MLRLAMQGIGDEPADIVESKGCQHDLLDPRSGLADRLERPQKRVRGADLVVPIGPDQQQVPHLRVRDQVLEEVERRRIQPLQIVEEQRERVLLPREDAEEPPEHHLESGSARPAAAGPEPAAVFRSRAPARERGSR